MDDGLLQCILAFWRAVSVTAMEVKTETGPKRFAGNGTVVEHVLKRTNEKYLPGHRKRKLGSIMTLCFIDIVCIFGMVYLITDIDAFLPYPKYKFSLFCDDLSLSASEDLRMVDNVIKFSTDKYGRNVCEFPNITYVVPIVTERIYRKRKAEGKGHAQFLSCGNRAFAPKRSLFTAYFTQVDSVTDGRFGKVIEWSKDRNTSFVGDSFRYQNGFLRVNSTSLFYVSLTLTIMSGISPTGSDMPSIVSISKQSRDENDLYPSRLLENQYLPCSRDSNGSTTIHIGSHVLVDKFDDLFIQISRHTRLVRESRGNTFSVYKLE